MTGIESLFGGRPISIFFRYGMTTLTDQKCPYLPGRDIGLPVGSALIGLIISFRIS